jgi:hypothetical protein
MLYVPQGNDEAEAANLWAPQENKHWHWQNSGLWPHHCNNTAAMTWALGLGAP